MVVTPPMKVVPDVDVPNEHTPAMRAIVRMERRAAIDGVANMG